MKSEQEKESIQAEILILERLDREGIPKIYDIKETGDYFYIIEEYTGKNSVGDHTVRWSV